MSSSQQRNRNAAKQNTGRVTYVQHVVSTTGAPVSTTDVATANNDGRAHITLRGKSIMQNCRICGGRFNTKFKYRTCWPCFDAHKKTNKELDAERVEMAKLMNDLAARKKAMGVKW